MNAWVWGDDNWGYVGELLFALRAEAGSFVGHRGFEHHRRIRLAAGGFWIAFVCECRFAVCAGDDACEHGCACTGSGEAGGGGICCGAGAIKLAAGDRDRVLQAMHPISDARQKQLDGLLADVGQEVIQISPDNLTSDRVTAYVTDVRQMPSGSGGEPDDLFILGSGRLQISDQSAIFFPQDSPSPIRSGGGSYTDSSGQTHLASEQIAGVIDRVQTMCNHAMNDTQQTVLATELAVPAQTLITPGNSVAVVAGQVQNAQMLPDGTLAVTTVNGSMSFGPSGQSYPGIVSATVAASPWGKGPVVVKGDANLLVIDGLLSFVLAGFLLASGIVLMRNSPMARWMLVGYGIAKLLGTVLSVCAVYTIGQELGGGDSDAQSVAMAWAIILGAPGAVWAVVVLIVMSLRSAREFLSVPAGAGSF